MKRWAIWYWDDEWIPVQFFLTRDSAENAVEKKWSQANAAGEIRVALEDEKPSEEPQQ